MNIKNEPSLRSTFGTPAWNRLKSILYPCCTSSDGGEVTLPCCPKEIYTLSLTSLDCSSSPGLLQGHFKATLNETIGIPAFLKTIIYNDSAVIGTNSFDDPAILGIAGSSTTSINIGSIDLNQGIVFVIIVDNYSNYSNIISIDTNTACP